MAVVKNSGTRTIDCAPSRMASRTQCFGVLQVGGDLSEGRVHLERGHAHATTYGPCARADPSQGYGTDAGGRFSRSRRVTRPMASSAIHPAPDAASSVQSRQTTSPTRASCRGCGPRECRKSPRRRPRRRRPTRAAGRHGERSRVRSHVFDPERHVVRHPGRVRGAVQADQEIQHLVSADERAAGRRRLPAARSTPPRRWSAGRSAGRCRRPKTRGRSARQPRASTAPCRSGAAGLPRAALSRDAAAGASSLPSCRASRQPPSGRIRRCP